MKGQYRGDQGGDGMRVRRNWRVRQVMGRYNECEGTDRQKWFTGLTGKRRTHKHADEVENRTERQGKKNIQDGT